MGEASIVGSKWKLVEVGRVVLIQGNGPYTGRLATIAEIIDHKRVRRETSKESGSRN
jgi:large subunit ribosomal protein L14e